MQDYINTMDEDTKKKNKADKLSKIKLKENVMINDESYYELKQGQEYYILVRNLTNDENYKGYYGMREGGYDVFQEKNGEYVNALTNRTLDIQNVEHTTNIPIVTKQSNREVKKGAKVNIGTYSLLSSSVPGYPLNINDEGQKINKQNIKINVETDGGTLVSWNSKTGKVKDLEKNVSFDLNKNIYWSPLCNNAIAKKANIKIVKKLT